MRGKDSTQEELTCGVAAVLFPTAIFTYYCARNINEFLTMWVVFAAIGAVALLALIAYLAVDVILRRAFPAFAFCAVCWLGCYMQWSIYKYILIPMKIPHRPVVLTVFILLTAVIIAAITYKIINTKAYAILFMLISLLLFLFNLVPLTWGTIQRKQSADTVSALKTQFFLDSSTKSPNVYWLHADGMLGVNAIEKYFHETQNDFLEALTERDFAIDSGACFEAAHMTRVAIPTLLCPNAYDTWISNYTQTHDQAMQPAYGNTFQSRLNDFRRNGELQNAFAQKGYETDVISSLGFFYPAPGGYLCVGWNGDGDASLTRYMPAVINAQEVADTIYTLGAPSVYLNWAFRFLSDTYQKYLTRDIFENNSFSFQTDISRAGLSETLLATKKHELSAIYEFLHGGFGVPRLMIVMDGTCHCPYIYNADGTRHENSMDPTDYYVQHEWGQTVVLSMVDMILDADPDAVIVIQADHGLHGNTEEEFRTAFGEDADAIELWNSTMSAIRVPEKYRTGEEHYALENPLNISRYLVNSFVGKNYEYLPPN